MDLNGFLDALAILFQVLASLWSTESSHSLLPSRAHIAAFFAENNEQRGDPACYRDGGER